RAAREPSDSWRCLGGALTRFDGAFSGFLRSRAAFLEHADACGAGCGPAIRADLPLAAAGNIPVPFSKRAPECYIESPRPAVSPTTDFPLRYFFHPQDITRGNRRTAASASSARARPRPFVCRRVIIAIPSERLLIVTFSVKIRQQGNVALVDVS